MWIILLQNIFVFQMDQLSESVFILKSHWTALEKRDDFFKNDNNKKQTAQKK